VALVFFPLFSYQKKWLGFFHPLHYRVSLIDARICVEAQALIRTFSNFPCWLVAVFIFCRAWKRAEVVYTVIVVRSHLLVGSRGDHSWDEIFFDSRAFYENKLTPNICSPMP